MTAERSRCRVCDKLTQPFTWDEVTARLVCAGHPNPLDNRGPGPMPPRPTCPVCHTTWPCQHTQQHHTLFQGYVPPMHAPPLRDGQTREARMLTEADVRRIIREELWRHDNPQRAYINDMQSQLAQTQPGTKP